MTLLTALVSLALHPSEDILSTLVNRVVQAGDKYFAVTPPQFVTTGQPKSLMWSPDGKVLFAVLAKQTISPSGLLRALESGHTEPPETRTVLVSLDGNKVNEVGRFGPAKRVTCDFLGASGSALISVSDEESMNVYRATAQPGNPVQNIVTLSADTLIFGSPTTDMALTISFMDGTIRLITQAGIRELTTKLPKRWHGSYWDKTGTMLQVNAPFEQGQVRTSAKSVLKPLLDRIELMDPFEPYQPQSGVSKFELEPDGGTLKLYPMIGESRTGRFAEVGTGVSYGEAELSDRGNAIAFGANGALFTCQVVPISKTAFEKLMVEAERRKVVSNSKQCALGIMMYMSDMQDKFPPKDGFYSLIFPYIKRDEVMKGFVYTYGGPEDASKLSDPANTELGYILGPGGKAIAYADGHVKWIPNK